MKIELRNWKTGEVIFTHKCENNTIKKTVEEAVKQGVSLAYANLYKANLAGAKLAGANLAGAELSGAELAGADLVGAKFDESQKDNILKAMGLVFHKGNDSK